MSEETKTETPKFPHWCHFQVGERRQLIANIVAKMNDMTLKLDENSKAMLDSDDNLRWCAQRNATSDGSRFNTASEFDMSVRGQLLMNGPAEKVYDQDFRINVTNKRSYPNGQLHATVSFDSGDGFIHKSITRGRRTHHYNFVCQKLVGKNLDTRNLFGNGGVSGALREVARAMKEKLAADTSVESVALRMQAVAACEIPVKFSGTGESAVYTADFGYMPERPTYRDNYTKALMFKVDAKGRVVVDNLEYHHFTEDEFGRLAALLKDVMDRVHAEEIIKGL